MRRSAVVRTCPVVLAVLLVTALLAGGCEDDPEPTFSSEPSASESSTGTPSGSAATEPTPTPLRMPKAAKQPDEAGARAFVRHYFKVMSRAMNDGDLAPVRRLSSPQCASCRAFYRNVKRMFAGGKTVKAEGWKPTLLTRMDASVMAFSTTIIQGQEVVRDRRGKTVRRFNGGRESATIVVKADTTTSWLMWKLGIG